MKRTVTYSFDGRRSAFILFIAIILIAVLNFKASAQTILLQDDFNNNTLDSNKWSVGNWKLGRTQLGNSPLFATEANTTYARLIFNTYQFKGTEIYSVKSFSRGNGLEVEARVKLNNLPSGLVTSLFTYTYDPATATSDELDIEILSKKVLQTPGGDPVLFTSWNNWSETSPTYQDGIHHFSQEMIFQNLDVNQWHKFIIRWLPTRTEWEIDGQIVYSSTKALPDAQTPVRLNFWAPASSWTEGYDSNLKPASRLKNNMRYFYDVDYVKVTQLP